MRKNQLNESIRLDVAEAKREAKLSGMNPIDFNALMEELQDDGAVIGQENNCSVMTISGIDFKDVIDAIDDLYDEEEGDLLKEKLHMEGEDLDDEEPASRFEKFSHRGGRLEEDDLMEDDLDEDDDLMEDDELTEKRRGCCPKHTKGLYESLKAFRAEEQAKLKKSEDAVKTVIDDINNHSIGVAEAREALRKLKAENAKMKKIAKDEQANYTVADVKGTKKVLAKIKEVDKEKAKDVEKFENSLKEIVEKALKEGRSYLYNNVKFNGTMLKDMSLEEIKAIYAKKLEEKKVLVRNIRTNVLNESANFSNLKDQLKKKNMLLEFLDNEITYRETRAAILEGEDVAECDCKGKDCECKKEDVKECDCKGKNCECKECDEKKPEVSDPEAADIAECECKDGECKKELKEDNGTISDEELANLFGPGQGEEAAADDSEEKSEDSDEEEKSDDEKSDDEAKDGEASDDNDGEEVELSRIEITLKSKEAADALMDACKEAGIDEDAMEIEGEDEEKSDEDEEPTEEPEEGKSEEGESEEGSEEAEEPAEGEDEESNESYSYANINALLFEGEDVDAEAGDAEATDDQAAEGDDAEASDAEGSEEGAEDAEGDDAEDEAGSVKFVLTNTDFAPELAKVLEDQYGITKEEFEDMIGGEIVEEEKSDDEAEEGESDDEATEKSEEDEKSEDSEEGEEKKDDEEDEMDPNELFLGL